MLAANSNEEDTAREKMVSLADGTTEMISLDRIQLKVSDSQEEQKGSEIDDEDMIADEESPNANLVPSATNTLPPPETNGDGSAT